MESYLYGIIQFADPAVEAICLANWDTNGTGYLNKEEAKAVTDIGTVFQDNTEITSFCELQYFIGLTELKANAFSGCTSLASIDLTNIKRFGGVNIFANTTSLNGLFIAPNAEYYVDYCLNNSMFTHFVNLGRPIEIRNGLFRSNMKNVKSIIIPASVTKIGSDQFYGDYSGSHTWIMKSSVPCAIETSNWSGTKKFYVPDDSVEAYKTTGNWVNFADYIYPISQLPTDDAELYEEIKDYL
jgi:hypothetical protein